MTVISERFDGLGAGDAANRYRLGIFGGTFDPIHIGHLAAAEQARDDFGLDAVIFMPAGNPVFKKGQHVTDAAHRLEMCRMACEENPFFDVSSLEIDRGGDTYTVDTLRRLRAHFPANVELYFISGADSMLSIGQWKESKMIAALAKLIAITRPGYHLRPDYRDSIVRRGHFDITYLEVTALAISSSDLRARLAEGKSIRYLAPFKVLAYIERHALYGAGR